MTNKKNMPLKKKKPNIITAEIVWGDSWTYMRTVVDMLHEPFLILDKDLRVVVGNECFYQMFGSTPKKTEGRLLFNLGNHEWNISELKDLLEVILPKDTYFKGFEVSQNFPDVGQKVMLLNAREIHLAHKETKVKPERIILLAMQDITEFTTIAHSLSTQHSVHKKELTALNKIVDDLKMTISELTTIIKNLSGFS